ncbi:hypothetical protein BDW68DRAFT_160494 [Aspergillus falconensis]
MPQTVQNIISESLTGYIRIEALEAWLFARFGVHIKVRYDKERFFFDAPEEVTRDEIYALRAACRVN